MMPPRGFSSRRFYHPQTLQYVDEELPTRTIKLSWPERRGPSVRAAHGTAQESPPGTSRVNRESYLQGSYRISGQHHDLAPGTYSLRITRLSLGVHGGGSAGVDTNGYFQGHGYRWGLWHSRDGTLDVIGFARPGHMHQVGGPMEPIYAVGPGTLQWAFLNESTESGSSLVKGLGSRVDLIQSMEGVLGVERVDV